jgi:nucleoside-diphosphate-sugar epimerase
MGASPDRLDFGARQHRPDEQMWMVGDVSRLAQDGGFRHSIGLDEGVALALRALDLGPEASSI